MWIIFTFSVLIELCFYFNQYQFKFFTGSIGQISHRFDVLIAIRYRITITRAKIAPDVTSGSNNLFPGFLNGVNESHKSKSERMDASNQLGAFVKETVSLIKFSLFSA